MTLNPAPPSQVAAAAAAAAGEPAEAPAPLVGPPGSHRRVSVPELLEQNFVGSQPRRETMLACSGNTRTTMIQLNEPLPERLYENADAIYYVIGGEGAVRI